MSDIKLELLEELRGLDKPQVHPHGWRCWDDGRLLENVQNGWVIGLDDDAGSGELNQMSHFLNHLYENCNLELRRPVIFLSGGEKPRKKEGWLDRAAARPSALSQLFICGGMENNRPEPKFLEGIQVNPQGLVGVVMHKSRWAAQGLLNALKRRILLRSRGS